MGQFCLYDVAMSNRGGMRFPGCESRVHFPHIHRAVAAIRIISIESRSGAMSYRVSHW